MEEENQKLELRSQANQRKRSIDRRSGKYYQKF